MKVTNQFMNSFEINVKEFDRNINNNGITYTIHTELGSDEFFEWVKFDSYNEKYQVERIDTHLSTNEMKKLYKLFNLKDKTVACVRDHHYPTDEILDYLQKWLDKNINKSI